MNLSSQIALGIAALAAGVGAVKLAQRFGGPKPLSARRKFVLDAISQVVPAQYGDAKFTRIAPGYDADDPNLPHGFTTCGYLPCYVGRVLNAPKCITQGGLEQMRTNGRKEGSWVDATGSNRPSPGDLFGIGGPRLIVHVGVIIDASGDVWKTADAGQGGIGTGQQAKYLDRPYDAATRTLGGPGAQFVPGKGWTVRGDSRTIAGWIDIDKVQGATP